jgi:bifunctional UDP-N-acetylglucosamine pyrophosphorylase/glucosamine-1-phosphate N-acetyltransferase
VLINFDDFLKRKISVSFFNRLNGAFMTDKNRQIINVLINKGVKIPSPDAVEIGDEVNPDRISSIGVILHNGCKIFGEKTLILSGSRLGYEAPVTIDNCQIGQNVTLSGGFFKDSVFLKNASFGSCAHVREGTILEEDASAAHCVGLKQTILFPYVTLGSQINFCDCLMAGGTDKKNHSEVGSSYIHFNFTPQQDKATASMMGDVPYGVMLNQAPIFLGGQGGLVGPSRLAFGITVSAGTILRKDELRPNRLIVGGSTKGGNIAYTPGVYSNVKRIFTNNIYYISNLFALMQWYQNVRYQFISDECPESLFNGLIEKLNLAIDERIRRLELFVHKLSESKTQTKDKITNDVSAKALSLSDELLMHWPEISDKLMSHKTSTGEEQLRTQFLKDISAGFNDYGKQYIKVIKNLSENDAKNGSLWMQGIIDQVVTDIMDRFSFFNNPKT